MKKNVIFVMALATSSMSLAQIGINTKDPKSTLDIAVKRDDSGNITDKNQWIGLLAPRVSLAELTSNTAVYATDQKGALIYITDILGGDNAGQRANINSAGYYYFDGTVWQILNSGYKAPWNVQGTTNQATDNTQNIYQNGNVAIGKGNAVAPLDVKGSIRGGERPSSEVVGANSFAAGENTTSSGANAFAFGLNSNADAANSVVFGNTNTASGAGSYVLGNNNTTDTQRTLVFGSSNVVSDKSHGSIVLGEEQIVKTTGKPINELSNYIIGKSIAIGYSNTINETKGTAIGTRNAISGAGATAVGYFNRIKGGLSYAFGLSNIIDGSNSTSLGNDNLITGTGSMTLGMLNNTNGNEAIMIGRKNTLNARTSQIMGQHNISEVFGETILGIANAITENKGETSLETIKSNSPLFQLGNGSLVIDRSGADVPSKRNNAITVLRDGSTGIGIVGVNDDAKPTQMLDIGSGNVRIRQINSNVGISSDNLVVADANGILKTISASAIKSSIPEIDGVIGNEVLNATNNSGVVRSGEGTTASPYTLGLLQGITNGQVMTWNAGAWNPANITNIYNGNGTLTSARTITQNGNGLTFANVQKTQVLNDNGSGIIQDSGTGTRASILLSNGGNNQLLLYTDTNNAAQIVATGISTSLQIGTGGTTTSAPINFVTSSGNGEPTTQKAQIDGNGKFNINNSLSVGYTNQIAFEGNEKLKINGSIKTISAAYPDYVFEDYYNGVSKIKPNYQFKSIYDIEKFIIENKHLPGVTSVSSLEKTENGYSYNLTDLSVQSLEKIEELYLHIIQQQKQIDEQKLQIEKLLKFTEQLQAKYK